LGAVGEWGGQKVETVRAWSFNKEKKDSGGGKNMEEESDVVVQRWGLEKRGRGFQVPFEILKRKSKT